MKKILLYAGMSLLALAACNPVQKNTSPRPVQDSSYTYAPASSDGTGKFYKGREIAQVMGAAGSDWLERDTRNQEENTEAAVAHLPLQNNSVVADIGAGTGYYSFRIAKKIPQGKLYAVDVQDEMISQLQQKKKQLGDVAVTVVKGSGQSPNLPVNSIDLALMVDVYHEFEYPKEILQALRLSLKPGGKLVLLEYRGEDPSIAIKALHKTTVLQLNKEMEAAGFALVERGEFLPIQHFLIYQKID